MESTHGRDQDAANASRPKRFVMRRTANLGAWVTLPVKAKAERDYVRLGYKNLSAYISALVAGEVKADHEFVPGLGIRSAVPVEARLTIILGSRVVLALDAVRRRVEAGENCDAMLAEMKRIGDVIAGVLDGKDLEYDAELDKRDEAKWGG